MIYAQDTLMTGHGSAIVVAGWTPLARVDRALQSNYRVLGSLYSPTRGISLIIRNLLANPSWREVYILKATREDENSGGCQALNDFFAHGFYPGTDANGTQVWLVRSSVYATIDYTITEEALNTIREHVICKLYYSVLMIKEAVEESPLNAGEPVLLSPMLFPMPQTVDAKLLPARRNGHLITGSLAHVYGELLYRIKTSGRYEGKRQELLNVMCIIDSFRTQKWMGIDSTFLEHYTDDILSRRGHYGKRLAFPVDQISGVISELKRDAGSTRAVATTYHPAEDFGSPAPPCLVELCFQVRASQLELAAVFRSHDCADAWLYNVLSLRSLQAAVAIELGVEAGELSIVSQSAHIYQHSFETVDRKIAEGYQLRQRYEDPIGYFIIDRAPDKSVTVTHSSAEGNTIREYTGITSALALARLVYFNNPTIEPTHLAFLAIECERALTDEHFTYDTRK